MILLFFLYILLEREREISLCFDSLPKCLHRLRIDQNLEAQSGWQGPSASCLPRWHLQGGWYSSPGILCGRQGSPAAPYPRCQTHCLVHADSVPESDRSPSPCPALLVGRSLARPQQGSLFLMFTCDSATLPGIDCGQACLRLSPAILQP